VPVHADIPHQEVIFLDETDPISSPMKAKGVGELGICGVSAAVANAPQINTLCCRRHL
jgi:xanthine dehydrogenase YagR molybdenum-binding subunit